MHKGFLKAGAGFALLSVILGAFGAHYIKDKVPAEALPVFETGVRYQFYHAFALLITGILYREFNTGCMIWAGRLFIAGIMLFSGSLYLITYLKTLGSNVPVWAGIMTPLGGAAFIAGWCCFLVSFFKAAQK